MDDDKGDSDSRWVKHPLAATFDLISSEYGWTDDQILDLTVSRLRLVQDVILMRKGEEFVERASLAEAHAVAIVGAMPALAQSPRSGRSIQKYIKKIRLFERTKKKKELPSYESVKRLFGG